MSRMHRLRRRAAHSVATHERARSLAAARLAEPLEPERAAWLDEHLASCDPCRTIAAAYEADRAGLRGLRDRTPAPPRDLWARTAAAIELGSGSRGRPSRSSAWLSPAWRTVLGGLSAVAVVAVVVGASLLSGMLAGGPKIAVVPTPTAPSVTTATGLASPAPTPILVGAGSVGWLGTGADGGLAYNVTRVNEVCPADRQPDCAPVADRDSKPVDLAIRPKSISQSPTRNQAVVVGTDASGGDAVLVIALPTTTPTGAPISTPTPAPTATPTPPADPTVAPTPGSPTPTPATVTPPPTPAVTSEPSPSIDATASDGPSPSPAVGPSLSPQPTVAASLAIVDGVRVVGESAAYSPDGAWFAFTARPSDGLSGPDIYLWHVGDPLARPLTTDHRSVFASWAGGRLLGSRAAVVGAAGEATPESFFIDPVSDIRIPVAGSAWRPIVDPAAHWAVGWEGTVRAAPDGLTTVPATGTLSLRPFTPDVGFQGATGSSTPVVDGPVTEFDVRWDETGRWLAVWLADASDPTIGRLNLLHLDPATGQLGRPAGAPSDVTALPGFSISNGRLAWATPPGQGGEGSRVQIVAWTADMVGAVESGPVQDVVVVH